MFFFFIEVKEKDSKMPAERKYCGTSAVLPPGYTDFDDRYSCLRKGFGVAKSKYGEAKNCRLNYNYFILSITGLTICIIVLLSWLVWVTWFTRNEEKDHE